ncbi:MAG: hypothetical protein RLZZ385_2757 [Pseudomonadota bacterium]|jgi:ADP-heptose:LPS heptosyltransferase
MKPAQYREQWETLGSEADATAHGALARKIAARFVDGFFASGDYDCAYIDLLCDMATDPDAQAGNEPASQALFGIVIERLTDEFEEPRCEDYNRVICRIIDYLLRLPQARGLTNHLRRFGLTEANQLLERLDALTGSATLPLDSAMNPKRIVLMSRLSIRADVAITSVICQRVMRRWPEAEIVVLGQGKLRQVMAPGSSGLRVRDVHFPRQGTLLERCQAWQRVLDVVDAEVAGLAGNEYLILDSGSSLTELGALPVSAAANYRYFSVGAAVADTASLTLVQLANRWLDVILGSDTPCHPKVWLEQPVLLLANRYYQNHIKRKRLVTVSLSVNGVSRRSLPLDFETRLVLALLREPGTQVILDMGLAEATRERSDHILGAAHRAGFDVIQEGFESIDTIEPGFKLLGLQCNIGEIAALIERSDEFIGYDSACLLIAAALGVRTHAIVTGTNNVNYVRRWRASGPNRSDIVFHDSLSQDTGFDPDELIERLLELRKA